MKRFIRVEKDAIRCYRLKKGQRQMVTIAGRLYRCDDDLFLRDLNTTDCAIIYEIDSTQPIMHRARLVNPDMTRAYIDSAKLSGNKKNIWSSLTGAKTWQYLTVGAIIFAIVYGFIIGSGGH